MTFSALVLYFIVIYIFEKIMKCLLGLHALEVIDKVFMLDGVNNNGTIIGCSFCDKFEYEEQRKFWMMKVD